MNALAELIRTDAIAARLHRNFRHDVLSGLAMPQKTIPARWFYDDRGSELFEDITRLPEYYPTRAETEILTNHAREIAVCVGKGRAVIEFGAGSAAKTPLLLDAVAPAAYVPIDISGDFLRASCKALAARFPRLPIIPLEGDFTQALELPDDVGGREVLGFFPGSTIGNLTPAPAIDLLRAMRDTLGEAAMLVVGMDLVKDRDTLIAAYDDAAGVTAAFNRNLLARINRELAGTIPLDAFRHVVRWNTPLSRIEMHLEAMRDIVFRVDGRGFAMRAGETIHTENSHKYDERSATMLLLGGGWRPECLWFDEARRFMVIAARAQAPEA